jgi:hypothetical protein
MERTISVDLSPAERELLRRGVVEWGGPARPTDQLARVMGFASVRALVDDGARLASALADEEPLSESDWARVLIATEIAFASNYYGSGVEWAITTGWRDGETVRHLRDVQRKIVGIARL